MSHDALHWLQARQEVHPSEEGPGSSDASEPSLNRSSLLQRAPDIPRQHEVPARPVGLGRVKDLVAGFGGDLDMLLEQLLDLQLGEVKLQALPELGASRKDLGKVRSCQFVLLDARFAVREHSLADQLKVLLDLKEDVVHVDVPRLGPEDGEGHAEIAAAQEGVGAEEGHYVRLGRARDLAELLVRHLNVRQPHRGLPEGGDCKLLPVNSLCLRSLLRLQQLVQLLVEGVLGLGVDVAVQVQLVDHHALELLPADELHAFDRRLDLVHPHELHRDGGGGAGERSRLGDHLDLRFEKEHLRVQEVAEFLDVSGHAVDIGRQLEHSWHHLTAGLDQDVELLERQVLRALLVQPLLDERLDQQPDLPDRDRVEPLPLPPILRIASSQHPEPGRVKCGRQPAGGGWKKRRNIREQGERGGTLDELGAEHVVERASPQRVVHRGASPSIRAVGVGADAEEEGDGEHLRLGGREMNCRHESGGAEAHQGIARG
eukprot:752396-Hanusia_phi.AAC.2